MSKGCTKWRCLKIEVWLLEDKELNTNSWDMIFILLRFNLNFCATTRRRVPSGTMFVLCLRMNEMSSSTELNPQTKSKILYGHGLLFAFKIYFFVYIRFKMPKILWRMMQSFRSLYLYLNGISFFKKLHHWNWIQSLPLQSMEMDLVRPINYVVKINSNTIFLTNKYVEF